MTVKRQGMSFSVSWMSLAMGETHLRFLHECGRVFIQWLPNNVSPAGGGLRRGIAQAGVVSKVFN